jgi:hypothetical protein
MGMRVICSWEVGSPVTVVEAIAEHSDFFWEDRVGAAEEDGGALIDRWAVAM